MIWEAREYIISDDNLLLNDNNNTFSVEVKNEGDRPIQVGSHYHFAEVNSNLKFDRNLSLGKRLNIPSEPPLDLNQDKIKK